MNAVQQHDNVLLRNFDLFNRLLFHFDDYRNTVNSWVLLWCPIPPIIASLTGNKVIKASNGHENVANAIKTWKLCHYSKCAACLTVPFEESHCLIFNKISDASVPWWSSLLCRYVKSPFSVPWSSGTVWYQPEHPPPKNEIFIKQRKQVLVWRFFSWEIINHVNHSY